MSNLWSITATGSLKWQIHRTGEWPLLSPPSWQALDLCGEKSFLCKLLWEASLSLDLMSNRNVKIMQTMYYRAVRWRTKCYYIFFFLFPLSSQSTLGYIALLISTFHVLIYGWKRAFEEEYYRFYTPPNFVLALVLPSIVILGKIVLLLPCVSRKLRRIRRGWEKSHVIEEVSGSAPHLSPERITVMWWFLLTPLHTFGLWFFCHKLAFLGV